MISLNHYICAASVVALHVAAGIVKKWCQKILSNFDGDVIPAPGPELRGKSLGLIRADYTYQWRCFFTSLPCWRQCLDMLGLLRRGKNLDSILGGWIWWRQRFSVATILKALLLRNLLVCVVSSDGLCRYGFCCSLPNVDLIALDFSFFLTYA